MTTLMFAANGNLVRQYVEYLQTINDGLVGKLKNLKLERKTLFLSLKF